MKLAVLTSHTIQYQTPLFKKLAKEVDLTVYFCWDFGMKETYDMQFKKKVSWDIPLLDGFKWKLLRNYSPKPSSAFHGHLNPGIVWELLKNRPDAILVYGWNGFTEWMAFMAAWLLGIKILIHSESPLNQEIIKSKWLLGIKKIGLGFLFHIMHAALYIGQENKKFYEFYGVPEKKLFFVPYAVDNERLISKHTELRGKKNEIRKELGWSKDSTVILFVGKLMAKKRPGDLLSAFKELSHATLVFVGDGELRGELEQRVKNEDISNVIFAGFKNQTKLPLYYEAVDILVLPSGIGETWGLVVNEAMCFELPVLVSDMVGCGEDLIKDGKNGFIFRTGDIGELKKDLKMILQLDSPNRISLEIIKTYSHEKDIEGIKAVLTKI